LTIGNEIFDHRFHVISNLSVDFILGDDFLDMNDAVIHKGDKTFSLLNGMIQVPFCIRGPPQIIAITPYEITIPTNSQQVLQVQFPFCKTNKVLMLKPLDNQNAVGFRVARTLVSVHGRKYGPVRNDSNETITLKYGTPIATASPILDIIRSCSDEESIGNINQQTSTTDPNTNKKYIHNLNILNKNINMYYNSTKQQDVKMTKSTYGNARRHFPTNRVQNDTCHSYGNDAPHSHANGAGQEYINKTLNKTH